MFAPLLAFLVPVALTPTPLQDSAPKAEPPSDAQLLRRFSQLPAELRAEFPEAFRAEVSWLQTFQTGLRQFVLDGQTRAPHTWPQAEEPAWFDPQVHAPGQPIRRKPLSPRSSKAKQARERFLGAAAQPALRPGFAYDWGSGELRRLPDVDDPERVFQNGLAGFPPDLDLALALVEQQLDDGAQRAALAAFGHAYTDRAGNVYPGVTLYDAFASGREQEMPDVDCLGVLHTVLDDWTSYRAPVPDRQHDALYEQIGTLFLAAHRHRGLRQALARCYLVGEPELRDGYGASRDALHALWDSAASTPAELAGRLPDAAGWRAFLDGWTQRVGREVELRQRGETRRATLAADARAVRPALVRVLTEFEAAAERDRAARRAEAEREAGKRSKGGG